MANVFKLFNMRQGEFRRVVLLFLILAIPNVGILWGKTIAYSGFLHLVGLEALPWILVASSAFSVIGIAVYGAFADRVAHDKLFMAIFAIGLVNIFIGLALLALGFSQIAYPYLYLLFLAWTAVVDSHFITYVNSFYDMQSAKRILPVVSTGGRVGIILAGFAMPLLTGWLAPAGIILVWSLTYIIGMALIWFMPQLLGEKRGRAELPGGGLRANLPGGDKKQQSYIESIKEGFGYTAQSTFLRWMAISTFVMMVLMALFEYQSSGILLKIYGDQKTLAGFLALLDGAANLVVLPLLLFGVPRIISRLGLGTASAIFPLGTLLSGGSLIFAVGFPSAVGAYLNRTAFRSVFQSPVTNLLYNAVPLRLRGRSRAFVGGLVLPIGSLVGGLVLMLPFASTLEWFIPALIGILALGFVAGNWIIRRQYSQALIKMLEEEDYSFLLTKEASELMAADPVTLSKLQKKLDASTNRELKVFIAQLIAQVGGNRAVPIVGSAARATDDARTRSALLDVLSAADLHDNAVRDLYYEFLTDPDGSVRQSAVAGLEEIAGPTDKQFLNRIIGMACDPDDEVRVRALAALARSADFYQLSPAVQSLEELLADQDSGRRAPAVRVLGEIHSPRAFESLVDYLADPADDVRLGAVLAIETAARSDGDKSSQDNLDARLKGLAVDKTGRMLQDPSERIRQAALVILGQWGGHECYEPMVNALADSSIQVRSTAVDVLSLVGKSIIPIVHPRLNSSDAQMRRMATVVLSRVNPRDFGGLVVETTVTGNLLTIYRNHGYIQCLQNADACASLEILRCTLREQSNQLLEEIFYLLGAVHDAVSLTRVHESLESEDANTRANAVEALESLTSPQTARLIGPLFDPARSVQELMALSKETWEMQYPDAPQAVRQLLAHPDDAWVRMVTVSALGEMGQRLATQAATDAAAKQPPTCPPPTPPAQDAPPDASQERGKRGRRRTVDLLGALMDGDAGADQPKAELKVEPKREFQVVEPLAAEPQCIFNLAEIEAMLDSALQDPSIEVRRTATSAKQILADCRAGMDMRAAGGMKQEGPLLSTIEKVIFLKEVSFFQGMTIDQLRVLANVCEELEFEKDVRIFNEAEPGGALYVVVNGKVAIEQEKRKGSVARIATIESHSYFGEMSLFDDSPHSAAATAVQDTLTLRIRREPLIVLIRQHPELSLELIKVLNARLREANTRISDLTRSRPRELHKLFDQFD